MVEPDPPLCLQVRFRGTEPEQIQMHDHFPVPCSPSVMTYQSSQGDRMGAVQAQVDKPVLPGLLIEIMGQCLIPADVLPPDHRVTDKQGLLFHGGGAGEVPVEPVVLTLVVRDAVIGGGIKGGETPPDPRKRNRNDRHDTEGDQPLPDRQPDRIAGERLG